MDLFERPFLPGHGVRVQHLRVTLMSAHDKAQTAKAPMDAISRYSYAYGRLSQLVKLYLDGLVDADRLRAMSEQIEHDVRADAAEAGCPSC